MEIHLRLGTRWSHRQQALQTLLCRWGRLFLRGYKLHSRSAWDIQQIFRQIQVRRHIHNDRWDGRFGRTALQHEGWLWHPSLPEIRWERRVSAAEDVCFFADCINGLPRKILGYKTPEELFDYNLDRIYAAWHQLGTAQRCFPPLGASPLLPEINAVLLWFVTFLKTIAIWYCNSRWIIV